MKYITADAPTYIKDHTDVYMCIFVNMQVQIHINTNIHMHIYVYT